MAQVMYEGELVEIPDDLSEEEIPQFLSEIESAESAAPAQPAGSTPGIQRAAPTPAFAPAGSTAAAQEGTVQLAARFSPEELRLAEQMGQRTDVSSALAAVQGIQEVGQGIWQAGLKFVAEPLKMVKEGATEEYTEKVKKQRAEYEAGPGERALPGAKTLAQMGVGLLVPFGPAIKTAASLPRAGIAASRVGAVGAVEGFLQFAPKDQDRIFNTVASGLVGSFMAGGMEIAKPFAGFMRKHLSRAYSRTIPNRVAYVEEGMAVGAAGYKLTPGAETKDVELQALENFLAQRPKAKTIFAEHYDKNAEVAVRNVTDLVKSGGGYKDAAELGTRGIAAYKKAVTALDEKRKTDWAVDLAPVRDAVGNTKFVKPTAVVTTLRSLIQEYDNPGLGEESLAIAGQLKRILAHYAPAGKTRAAPRGEPVPRPLRSLDIDELTGFLHNYSAKAAGKGNLFRDVLSTGPSKRVSHDLTQALMEDLDASSKGIAPDLATTVRAARTKYHGTSQAIRDVRDTTMGAIVGKRSTTPEEFSQAFLSLPRSAAEKAVVLLQDQDPALVHEMGTHIISRALEAAQEAPTTGLVRFSPGRFLRELNKYGSVGNTALAGHPSRKKLITNIKALERMLGTEPRTGIAGMLGEEEAAAGLGGFAVENVGMPNFGFVIKTLMRFGGTKFMARMLTDRPGMEALKTLNEPRLSPQRAAWATGVLMGHLTYEMDARGITVPGGEEREGITEGAPGDEEALGALTSGEHSREALSPPVIGE